jgi:PAS domain S-box-containing protein
MPSQQRRQIFVLAPAVLIIIIPNFLYLSGRSVFFPYDPTPVALAIVGILFLLSIYIHKFIEVMPVAHAQVFKNMRSAVIIIDSRDKIMEINPAAERIFNKLQTDVVGKNVLELLPECEKLIKGGIFYNEIKTEIELQNTGRIFELKINSLDDTKGHNTGRVILLFDITEQKEALNELDAYARTVAHDLKNPLNIILGHAQLIEEGCVENKDLNICRYLKGLTQGAMHMNDIIEALLLLAQVRNIDRVDAHPVDIKLNLNTALQRLEANIKESNATIIQSEEMIDSYGHNIWIQEVWVNLISNAIKFSERGSGITLGISKFGQKVRILVEDCGPGISTEDEEKMFKKFQQLSAKPTEGEETVGLGLSIVKKYTEMMGGEVSFYSEIGRGTQFYVDLKPASI